MRAGRRRPAALRPRDEAPAPIRGELFGAVQLGEHARALARGHRVAPGSPPGWFRRQARGPLLSRLAATEAGLIAARDTLARAATGGVEVGPAGAWLLDNFFVVLEQVPEIRATLPASYYQELPKLAGPGRLAGYPRIYDIVVELIAHTDGRLDEASVALMLREYQRITPLSLGELWAVPAMLRMGYLENIRRMARRAARDTSDRALADVWVSRLLSTTPDEDDAGGLVAFVNRGPTLTPAFLTRFLHQLRRRRADFTPLAWLEPWISEDVMTVEDAAQRSVHELALTQLVMANSIASLRAVASVDWVAVVEGASATEAILRSDPSGAYADMTRGTRDMYRHAVERLAKGTRSDERRIAEAAVRAAAAITRSDHVPRASHVGYHLVGDGQAALERAVGFRGSLRGRAQGWLLARPAITYFGSAAIALGLALAAFVAPLTATALSGSWWLLAAAAFALLPAADAALALVHQGVTLTIPPRRLPRLDYAEGVPTADRAVVVVPILLGSVDQVTHALAHLEVQFLANRDPEVRFALLSDFLDAPTPTAPLDAAILASAVEGMRLLNATYSTEAGAPFYLLHRDRRWNAADAVWMGWERKRGKLVDLNALLAGAAPGAFSVTEGDLDWLGRARYVITLDADTVLPRGGAAALIGTIAHPLNRAEYDAVAGRVVRGYGILQPRVSVALASASESRYAAVYSGHPGVDPYTTAVSDVYQDLFGEGSFTGKGIYDVDVFRRATAGRFPENTLLSHDLIEGAFARAGLVTDIEVFDDYPTRYLTATRRAHRWIRGDWQLLKWITPGVPGMPGANRSPLSGLSRWKIADNLRRSLTPLALLAWFVAAWTVLPGAGLAWTATIIGALSAPWLIPTLFAAARPPRGQAWRPYYAALGLDATRALQQVALALLLLPDQALLALDAILRSLARVSGAQGRMLEWQTSSQAEDAAINTRRATWQRMWPAVAVGGCLMAAVAGWWLLAGGPGWPSWTTMAAWSLLTVAWLAAPEAAIALSAPLTRRDLVLDETQRASTLRYALRHWRYFDQFVTAGTHWLVPDNFQETPEPVVATRTSPTNIGLQLLATVSACDLGFLTRSEAVERLERTLDTLDTLPRVEGHFFNWYDLGDLRVLDPPYVSAVDSGNLAGHLVALAQGCLSLAEAPVDQALLWDVLDAEGIDIQGRRPSGEAATTAPWTGERLVAYQALTLDLRRRALLATTPEAAERTRRARLRLDATVTELTALALDPETPAARSLRAASTESPAAASLVQRLESVAARAREMAMAMDFRLVYNPARRLFAIGYDARTGTLDDACYDLLASESRLASFIAIAKGDVPSDHWFRLGRSLTVADRAPALVSWSGSMFEYLMPLLVMPPRPFSLLDQTCHSAVQRQVAYGRMHGVPWGISESAYNVRDRHGTYQYRAFGVPDLALKRGLSSDLVVAPYATALAMAVDAHDALRNLSALEAHGALGEYGFHDAIDFTRANPDASGTVVRTFMAHHVGMSLVAFHNALSIGTHGAAGVWPERFMADAAVRAAGLLLDERVPRRYVPRPPQRDIPTLVVAAGTRPADRIHVVDTPHTPEPHVALLGGRSYSVLLTNGGGGRSRAGDVDVLRWRADATQEDTGQWLYVRDLEAGTLWSAGYQPVRATPDEYRVTFASDRVTFSRRDGDIDTFTEVVVVTSEQAEIRRVTLVNRSSTPRDVELTSYGEVVLCPAAADRAHPAFQKLSVATESPAPGILLASRRPRAGDEAWPWGVHVVATGPERIGEVTHETDRARFIGRGRSVHAPRALDHATALSGTTGAVLDPVFALRVRLRVPAGRSSVVAFTTAVAATREGALQLADRYDDLATAERALSLARTESDVEVRDLDLAPTDVALFQELAGAMIYPHEALRAPEADRSLATGGQSSLWAQGISGDWPILLATIRGPAGMTSIRQLLQAHTYWRMKGVRSDLVILNDQGHSYAQELHDQLTSLAAASGDGGLLERPGGVFVRRADALSAGDIALLRTTARIHVLCDGVGFGEVVAANILSHAARTRLVATVPHRPFPMTKAPMGGRPASPRPAFANGFGGRTDAGDYAIDVAGAHVPPAPWANVIANPRIGFCVTERGGGFAWAENSHFYRLTPWHNDPVADPPGEVIYLQDLDSGATWTPTPAPAPAIGDPRQAPEYHVVHAPGITHFRHQRALVSSHLSLAVDAADPVKLTQLILTNHGTTARRLCLTSYVEWALGAERERTQHEVRTWRDAGTGAVFARNPFAPGYGDRVAFSWISEACTSHTGNREHFIGRHGDLASPAALAVPRLSGATGTGHDPCAALRAVLDLAPGASHTIVILLGAAAGEDEARALIARHGAPGAAAVTIAGSGAVWERRLSVIRVRTPDPDFDALLNKWSLYQALACRMWARSALYQSSGAFGFRDQLQDCMAFVHAEPGVAREHILRAASRQFVEGDVQHWWHEPGGRGVRTRFSDDLAWLPFVADHYVRATGDTSLWDDTAPWLVMPALAPGEAEAYDLPREGVGRDTLYEHCVRALDRACTIGAHGLPLIGGGDWNDGMNRVGRLGRGESVWLAWFLATTLTRFAVHADARDDAGVASRYLKVAASYVAAVEATSWDGAWYRRAFFDDGTALGTSEDTECRIDAIAQSWAVLSGAGDPARARRAMQSVNELLVREHDRLVLLLAPPFDTSARDPGYIKGYLPGVRENGAQYTHAALWTVLAMTTLGDGDRAGTLMRMLNPFTRARTPAEVATWQVEPYVVAADVYAGPGNAGRGGWTWYTGSASWSYRVALEGILGFDRQGDVLRITPCIPSSWPAFSLEYRFGGSTWSIEVRNPHGVCGGVDTVLVDGQASTNGAIALRDDGAHHAVVVTLGH